MCGEHLAATSFRYSISGSSPHVRGALGLDAREGAGRGIIPACAGSTDDYLSRLDGGGIIPACAGSTLLASASAQVARGSSPHVRGARDAPAVLDSLDGIIPACAGSTMSRMSAASKSWDHPRMCGEHESARPSTSGTRGSSPHVRGALLLRASVAQLEGIIPACAGSTTRVLTGRRLQGDHPRMCGEHTITTDVNAPLEGSSPHVRGAPCPEGAASGTSGIIPACAGSTGG